MLYQMDVMDIPPDEALPLCYEYLAGGEEPEFDAPQPVRPFAEQLIYGVFTHKSVIDQRIVSASEHWRLERMSIVDRNILRIALYEMLFCPDIPPKVSINEAVDLGKTFGSEDSGAFINGILDHLLPELSSQAVQPSVKAE